MQGLARTVQDQALGPTLLHGEMPGCARAKLAQPGPYVPATFAAQSERAFTLATGCASASPFPDTQDLQLACIDPDGAAIIKTANTTGIIRRNCS
jgi:hypothetical protein